MGFTRPTIFDPILLLAFAWGVAGSPGLRAQDAAAPGDEERGRIAWRYAPDGAEFAQLLYEDGTVFAIDRTGKVHAIDASNGAMRWVTEGRYEFSRTFGLELVRTDERFAIAVGCDTGLVALDAETGEELWNTEVAGGCAGPARAGRVLVAASSTGSVHGFDVEDGHELWETDFLRDRPEDPPGFRKDEALFGGVRARPGDAASDGEIVVFPVFDQCRIVAVDPANGRRLWAFQAKGWTHARPAIAERYVFFGSQDQYVYAVDKEIGKLAWKVRTRGRNEAPAAPSERFLYYPSCDGNLYAIDEAVGLVRWKFPTDRGHGAPLYGRPLVIDDTVYLGAMWGGVFAIDRETGVRRWHAKQPEDLELNSDLATDGERLFVTTRRREEKGRSSVLAFRLE